MERVGVQLALRQAQADAGDITLLYADESEALTHPYLAHAWAEKGADLRVRAPGTSRKIAMTGALDAATRELTVSTSPTKTSADVIRMLRRPDWRYGLKPGCDRRPVVLVWDNGPVHTSRAAKAALAERPWITVEWLPRYAPELNDIEWSWRDLKRHHLTHRTFRDSADLDTGIQDAVKRLNKKHQTLHPCNKLNKAA